VGSVGVLDRRVLTVREAARQLRIPETTLVRWVEGWRGRGDRHHPPVLREEPTGIMDMTWGEMVEARYLRAYRQKDISLQKLRPVIAALRQEYGTPYPLAHFRPYIGTGRRLLLELQKQHHLPESLRMVYEASGGQLILDRRVEEFLDRVDFSNEGIGEAERMRPAGRTSPVVMDPRIKSGTATVRGVRTEIFAELAEAGMSVDEISVDFDLPADDVKAALAYEWTPRAA
jgi:uncharacterized protein (DUF433 family)